ncbi:MAG: amphi-Trp domain-containing protein [Thermoleophilia bacterium]|jgi:amphi-Trp domain-containing protein|nr:amphi-Trp domain-containing protein [Thermoleophilia bacterium]
MAIIEIESRETLTREEAAARLRTLADELERHNEVEFDWGGKQLTVRVADEVSFELEIEVGEDGETELEIELKWRH